MNVHDIFQALFNFRLSKETFQLCNGVELKRGVKYSKCLMETIAQRLLFKFQDAAFLDLHQFSWKRTNLYSQSIFKHNGFYYSTLYLIWGEYKFKSVCLSVCVCMSVCMCVCNCFQRFLSYNRYPLLINLWSWNLLGR